MSGASRIINGEIAQSKVKGEAMKKKLYAAFDNDECETKDAEKVEDKKKQEKY